LEKNYFLFHRYFLTFLVFGIFLITEGNLKARSLSTACALVDVFAASHSTQSIFVENPISSRKLIIEDRCIDAVANDVCSAENSIIKSENKSTVYKKKISSCKYSFVESDDSFDIEDQNSGVFFIYKDVCKSLFAPQDDNADEKVASVDKKGFELYNILEYNTKYSSFIKQISYNLYLAFSSARPPPVFLT
jgi:phage anti-repressor protein